MGEEEINGRRRNKKIKGAINKGGKGKKKNEREENRRA